jgi:hypothetical protein
MRRSILGLVYVVAVLGTCFCLSIAGCEKKSVRGDKVGAVEGFVKESINLAPIVGADVYLDDVPCPKTDSTGYYKAFTFVGDERVSEVTIEAQGYKAQDRNVVLKPNQTQRLDFLLVKE